MGDLFDYLEDTGLRIGSKIKRFFVRIFIWLGKRWLINMILGFVALMPYVLGEMGVIPFNDLIRTLCIICAILGVIFMNFGSIGFVVRIISRIMYKIRYR